MSEEILWRQEGSLIYLGLNRPGALNALSQTLLADLDSLLARLEADPPRGLLIYGEGRGFAAGADLKEMSQIANPAQIRKIIRFSQGVLDRVARLPFPTAAAIHGFALGGGLELALACDFRVATPEARLGLPEVGLGLIPGFGGTQRLPALIGGGPARELILTGTPVSGQEALRLGLVNRVADDPRVVAQDLLTQVTRNSPRALALAKQALRRREVIDLETEADLFALAFAGPDRQEGIAAFMEKRPANFGGE